METDSSLSTLALALSLLVFIAVALLEASISAMQRERVHQLVSQGVSGARTLESLFDLPMGPAGGLSVLRFLALTGGVISVVALVIVRGGVGWPFVTVISAGLLIFVGFVHTYTGIFTRVYGETASLRFAFLARWLTWLFLPLLWTQSKIISGALSARGELPAGASAGEPAASDGEPLDEHERRMIRGVVELDKTVAREIMAPRPDVVAAETGTSLSDLAELMFGSGHSRIPIYRDNIDHIEGIAYSRDVLRYLNHNEGATSVVEQEMIRPALFIPESKTLEELLREFQERRVHMAIVVDEYGGVSGLVTIEDLLEEIVGEIEDEFDIGGPEVVTIGENEFMLDARVSVDQLHELLEVTLEGDGFDTVGGFVYQHLGKIPSPGDTVESDGLRIEVVSTIGRRLKKLRVTRSAPEPGDSSSE